MWEYYQILNGFTFLMQMLSLGVRRPSLGLYLLIFRVTWYLVICVCFVDRCLSFCTFSFYGFWLPLWYLHSSCLNVAYFGNWQKYKLDETNRNIYIYIKEVITITVIICGWSLAISTIISNEDLLSTICA
jgi:hypothetical protein